MTLFQALVGAVVGTMTGLIPLVAGARRNNTILGVAGFFASMVCGAVMGILLAGPVCAVFYWLIVRNDDIPAEKKTTRNLMIGGIIGLCIVLGSAGMFAAYKIAYKKNFINGFKTSFISSCLAGDTSSMKRAICECAANETVERRTVEQMKDLHETLEFIKTEIVPGCIVKAREAQNVVPPVTTPQSAPVEQPTKS